MLDRQAHRDDSLSHSSTGEQFVLPRERKTNKNNDNNNEEPPATKRGRWSTAEKLLFLKGLRLFGGPKWKEIRLFVGSR